MAHPILLYDGVCGLCNRFIKFILSRDPGALFRFASLQSTFAARILARQSSNPSALDTMCVVLNFNEPNESILTRSDAVVFVLQQLGGFWRFWAGLLQLLPRSLRDWKYRFIARHRYRIFGRYDTCPVPSENDRARFLDL